MPTRPPLALAVLLLGRAAGAQPPAQADEPPPAPAVVTAEGPVSGFVAEGVERYYGIPFAAPPVGELRWVAPRPAPARDTTLAATAFAASPMSHDVWGDMRYRSGGFAEDCLYLNVWAPAGPREGLPVLVYYYGGGLVAGDASETRYDGAALAREGIVVVTANYRLNVFGFLAHPELSAAADHGASGNYGHLDQVAALRWVRDNVAAFGGDPARITVGGESAGSWSVSTLCASPLARDLLAGAIGQSGAAVPPTDNLVAPAVADATGAAFARAIGAASLAELRALPADTLYARYRRAGGPRFPIVRDGYLLPASVTEAYAAGEVPAFPLLAGWNSRESPAASLVAGSITPATFAAAVRAQFGAQADALLAALPHDTDAAAADAARVLASDRWMGYPTWRWLDLHAATTGAPAFRYYFDQPPPGETEGAPHAAEIPYALGNLDVHDVAPWTDDDRAAGAAMVAYFANFIRTGDPNGEGLPTWPPLEPGAPEQPVLTIRPQPRVGRDATARYRALGAYFGSPVNDAGQ